MTYCVYVDWTLEEIPRAFYVGEGRPARAKTCVAIANING